MNDRPEPTAAPSENNPLTIGVFDSGFGGLTVLRALLALIPHARYIYLGDTARLPYGSKSRETIARYAVSSARFLHEQGAQLLVVACNTATALALSDIEQSLPIPVIGVVDPGAHAALASTEPLLFPNEPSEVPPIQDQPILRVPHLCDDRIVAKVGIRAESEPSQAAPLTNTPIGPNVLVLATQATVQSHAYTHALNALGLAAHEKACPLLVPLVEEGWTDHPVTDEVIRIYLTEALAEAPATGTLLLGCTHYPLIAPAIHRVLTAIHHPLTIIDSAEATARATAALVATHFPDASSNPHPTCTFYATDSIEKFQRLGSSFLGQPVAQVNLVDLGG